MIIIGITGTIGAGKGTIVKYLVKEKHFTHFSVRDFLVEHIKKRGLPVNRDTMTSVANDLRYANSSSYIADELFRRAEKTGNDCVIESLRTPGEVESLRKKPEFYLFAVDARPELRFERIRARGSETDQVDFQTFRENEKREMSTDNPNKQNLQKCISMADFKFINNGTISQLEELVEKALKKLRKKDDPGHLRRRFCPRT